MCNARIMFLYFSHVNLKRLERECFTFPTFYRVLTLLREWLLTSGFILFGPLFIGKPASDTRM